MSSSVTLTYDPAERRTTVAEAGRPVWSSTEPEGMVGACRLGSFYASSVQVLTIRRARVDAARIAS